MSRSAEPWFTAFSVSKTQKSGGTRAHQRHHDGNSASTGLRSCAYLASCYLPFAHYSRTSKSTVAFFSNEFTEQFEKKSGAGFAEDLGNEIRFFTPGLRSLCS